MFKHALMLLLLSPAFAVAAPLSAQKIVALADEVRNPQIDYSVEASIVHYKPNKTGVQSEDKKTKYKVMIKGKDKAVIETIEPAVERGRSLLLNDNNMWVIMPGVSKPVRVSMQQKLMGEVSNGDLARANFAEDYKAKVIKRTKATIQLELTAKTQDVTYARVIYWVSAKKYHPIKAEFYAVSGRLLKKCYYGQYKMFGGRLRPTELVMENPLIKGQKSVIAYNRLVVSPLPDKYFNKEYLKKI